MKLKYYLILLVGFCISASEAFLKSRSETPFDPQYFLLDGVLVSTAYFLLHTSLRLFTTYRFASIYWKPVLPSLYEIRSFRSALILATFSTQIILESYILGAFELLTPLNALLITTLFAFAVLVVGLRFKKEIKSDATEALKGSFILFSILTCARVFKYVEYDSLVYHLYLPAQWIQHHSITHIPILFGDQAAAYAPRLGELVFLQFMLPFSYFNNGPMDRFASVGQFPFFVFILNYCYQLLQENVANKKEVNKRFLVFTFIFACPMILLQAFSASVDLIFATFLLIAYSAIVFTPSPHSLTQSLKTDLPNERFFLSCLAMALALETKFLGLIYLPVFIVFLFFNRTSLWFSNKRNLILLLCLCAALLSPTYFYNWIQYGSPIFPAKLDFFGIDIFHGAYTSSQMVHNPFHFSKFSNFLQLLLIETNLWLIIGIFIIIVLHFATNLGSTKGQNSNSIEASKQKSQVSLIMASVALGLILIHFYLVPYNTEVRFLSIAVVMGSISISIAFSIRNFTALASVLIVFFLFSIKSIHRNAYAKSLSELHSWAESTQGPIAYTGFNTAFVLFDSKLNHTVRYVPINRFDQFAFHDYLQLFEKNGQTQMLTGPKPNLERLIEEESAWIQNLSKFNVSYVVAGKLHPNERAYMRADSEGYPVEYGWMTSKPDLFKIVFETSDHKVFKFGEPNNL